MSNKPKFEVGYPVFLLKKDTMDILPGIVCGQTTNKTLKDGTIQEEVVLHIMMGPKDNRKLITTDKISDNKFDFFANLHDLKDKLFDDIVNQIGKNVTTATKNLKSWYESEISLTILATALEKQEKFQDISNKSFQDIVGAETAKAIAEPKTSKQKSAKPTKKKLTKQQTKTEPKKEVTPTSNNEGETVVRIKIPDGKGGFRFVTPDEFDEIGTDVFFEEQQQ